MTPDIPNFRDAGGHPTGDFANGVVFRASELDRASAPALAQLSTLKVSDVFDLRTAAEVAVASDHLASDIVLHHVDVMADGPANGASAVAAVFAHHVNRVTVDQLNEALGDGRAFDLMVTAYGEFVTFDSAHSGFRELLLGVARAPGTSVVHCTAGKDRTGWGIALMQFIAGVGDDEIVTDYLASNDAWAPLYAEILAEFTRAGGDADALGDILWVRPGYLNAAFEAVDRTYGSRAAYLRDGLGLTASDLTDLRHRLSGQPTGSAN